MSGFLLFFFGCGAGKEGGDGLEFQSLTWRKVKGERRKGKEWRVRSSGSQQVQVLVPAKVKIRKFRTNRQYLFFLSHSRKIKIKKQKI